MTMGQQSKAKKRISLRMWRRCLSVCLSVFEVLAFKGLAELPDGQIGTKEEDRLPFNIVHG